MSQQSLNGLIFDDDLPPDTLPAHCQSQVTQPAKQPAKQAIQPAPIARKTDPPTSQQSAQETSPKLNALHRAFIDVLKSLARPATASEVAELCHQRDPSSNTESYRKRAKECCDRNAIKIAGTKRCEITGKKATSYSA